MSRTARVLRWTLPLSIALFIAMEVAFVYLFVMRLRIDRELTEGRWREPTIITSVAKKQTKEVARLYGSDWRPTAPALLERMPPHVGEAFLAAEDVRFRRHLGIDPIGILRALVTNVRRGGIEQGGSTISQQVVKQRYLTNDRTWTRKITEAMLAIVLDVRLTKDEILELYLNEVYLGHLDGRPLLGVDEASLLYFDKEPHELRVEEAATIASTVRAPNRDNPHKRPDLVRARRDAILEVMRDRRWISDEEFSRASARPLGLDRGSIEQMPYPFYLRALREDVVREAGLRRVMEGGLKIACEMDVDAQREAENAARRGAQRLESRYRWIRRSTDPLQVALLSVDPSTGGVRALVGGRDARSAFDHTKRMHRQPGSAFKTFAYLAAIKSRRATNATLLLDTPIAVRLSAKDTWEPQNYDQKFRGRVTLRESFERSLNVPTVRLTQQIGVQRVASTARAFGFEGKLAAIPALPLGVADVTMRELTAAYTAFPNLGERVEPYLLHSVDDRRGKTIFRNEIRKKRVVDADVAFVTHSLLRGVVKRGTARSLSRYGLGYAAGKTGTTNDYRDAWFVGYTPDMVTTVWVGFDRGAPLRLSSAEAAIPIWASYMRDIPHRREEPRAPAGVTFRDIDPESGMLWRKGCPGPINEVFLDGTAPTRHCPTGIMGRIVRRVLFDSDNFDEPTAITFDQFRRWANEADRNRQQVEKTLDRLKRIFD